MPFPNPMKDVPRDMVGTVIDAMLLEKEVSGVEAHAQPDGKFTVIPHHTSFAKSSSLKFTKYKKPK